MSFHGHLDWLTIPVHGSVAIESAHMLSYLLVTYGSLTQFLEPSFLSILLGI